jgi:uncharacterized protein (TIGR02757 family)
MSNPAIFGSSKHFKVSHPPLYLDYVKDLLEEKVLVYNNKSFIENDPISIPHRFTRKEDIEIAGFFAATLAWGNRKSILKNAGKLMEWMDNSPYEFVVHHSAKDLSKFGEFVHRTFNGEDCQFFIRSLKNIYVKRGGLENIFIRKTEPDQPKIKASISSFRKTFLQTDHNKRSEKHISNPYRSSSAKRLCMYLRWMVRNDKKGVDFGIWNNFSPSELFLPLDIHTGNISRKLGLLQRKQNDWEAVEEVTNILRKFDPADPVKYDFALFGLGVDRILK